MNKIQPKTKYLGKNIIYLPTCHSTNDYCNDLIKKGDISEGTLAYTDFQTSGRGQRGNVWESNRGENVMASLILKPVFLPTSEQFGLNIAFSLATYETLQPILGDKFKIKWPNDLYFSENKLGGILIENTLQGTTLKSSVIGFGINVNQIDFQNSTASSLKKITKIHLEVNELIETILLNFERNYESLKLGNFRSLHLKYSEILFGKNEIRLFEAENKSFQGEIIGVTQFGKLEVLTNSEIRIFDLKEIRFIMNSENLIA